MRRRTTRMVADIPEYSGPRTMAPTAQTLRFLQSPGRLPPGQRIYVIGDIHGHRDRLIALHAQIAEDLHRRPTRSVRLIHLGDYINQGPDSAGVIRHLMQPPPLPTINLMGDQERMLLDALDGDRAAATDWLWAGGRESLPSWDLAPDLPREAWPNSFPADHIAWLRGLALTHRQGSYLFVHAGIRPGTRLDDQTREDALSIRQPFLSSEQDHGVIIVHGHSTSPSVTIASNRIGLDTGAGIGGKLACAVLEDDAIGLLAV